MPFIDVDKVAFHYLEAGEGAPVLLLGGTLSSAQGDFGAQLEGLSSSRRAIAPDRRGYGRTRPPDRTYPDNFYQRDASDMAAFIDAMNLESTAVLGWSEGADVAMCLAALHPNRVTHLVIWGGVSCVEAEDICVFEGRRDVTKWHPKAREAMTAIYGDGYWQRTWQGWCDVMVRLHATGGDVHLPRLEEIKCPTLILHGAKDPLIRPQHPHTLHHRIPHSTFEVFSDAGHNLHVTRAADFNQRVLEFLGNQRKASL